MPGSGPILHCFRDGHECKKLLDCFGTSKFPIQNILDSMGAQVIAGCRPFPVHMAIAAKGPSPEELELAFLQAKSVRWQ